MRFYEVKVEMNTLAEENETATQQNLDRQNISRKTDAFLEEYEERAYIFVVGAEKRLELAVCVKDELLDVKALVEAMTGEITLSSDEEWGFTAEIKFKQPAGVEVLNAAGN